jgi:hypothetical protein
LAYSWEFLAYSCGVFGLLLWSFWLTLGEFLAYSWGVFGLLLWSFWLTLWEFLAYSCHDVTDEIMMTDSLFVF